jgi:O-antigen/teichoic acid export membrane protein
VACYALAVGLCSAWGFLPEALIEGLQPAILEAYTRDRQLYLRKNRQLYALIFYGALGVSLVMCLLADPLVRILYGDEYALAADALRIVVWYTAFSYLGGARDAWVVCEGVQKHLKYIYIGAALINVALNGAMIPLWGIRGAAVASLLTQMATVTLLPALIPALRPNGKLMLEAILLRRLGKKEKG